MSFTFFLQIQHGLQQNRPCYLISTGCQIVYSILVYYFAVDLLEENKKTRSTTSINYLISPNIDDRNKDLAQKRRNKTIIKTLKWPNHQNLLLSDLEFATSF